MEDFNHSRIKWEMVEGEGEDQKFVLIVQECSK